LPRGRRRAISLGVSALIVIGILVIVGFAVYLNDSSSLETARASRSQSLGTPETIITTTNTSTSSSTSSYSNIRSETSASPLISNVTSAANGLEFTMSLNLSTVQQGQVLGVTLNLSNTLDRVNNITGVQDWKLTNASENSGSADVGWNCAQTDVFRIEVVSGYYDLNNFTEGTPLDVFIWQPPYGMNQCLFYVIEPNTPPEAPLSVPSEGQNNYVFAPKSDVAQWITAEDWSVSCGPANSTIYSPCPQIGQEAVMSETMILKPALFTNSTSGTFTVIGGDEWGDLLVAHFATQ